jgi:hypothetical protein
MSTRSPTLNSEVALDKKATEPVEEVPPAPAIQKEIEQASAPAGPPGIDMSLILRGKKLAVVFSAMLLSVLLIALDQTVSHPLHRHPHCKQGAMLTSAPHQILATALPRIASDFNAFQLQGWVASAFVLTQSALSASWRSFVP